MKKERLLKHIESMTDEQIELIGNLLNYASYPDYSTKLKLCGISDEQRNKIDSAIPCDYAKSIREIYPDFNNGNNVYDYNSQSFGSMLNLNNKFVSNLVEKLKLSTL